MAEDLDVPPPPVHRIPAELLSGVFRFLPRWEAADSFDDIISISHTCRRWRAVSLGCGELWATLPLDFGVMWTEAALERSGTFPLSVNISRALDYSYFGYGGPPPKRLDIVRIALAELSRIQELVITIPGDTLRQFPEMSELLRLICSAPATLLEKLKVTAQNMQHIPSNLFTGAIPEQLRSLEVWNIDFDPGVLDNGLRFPHLHHLELVGCRLKRDHPILRSPMTFLSVMECEILDEGRLDHLVEVLSFIPTLENLELVHNIHRGHVESWTTPRPGPSQVARAQLPKVQSFVLKEEFTPCFGLLRRLSLPLSTPLEICATVDEKIQEDLVSMFHQSLSSHYAAADTAGLVFLSGKITFEDDLTFLANEAYIHRPSGQCLDECDADQNGHPPSLGELKLCLDDPDHESLPLFRALFTLPVFQNLRTLDISCWDFLTDGAEWHRVFDTLQNVVSLTVHGCESRVWVSMDERDVASAADGLVCAFDVDDDQSHFFPKLERLRVCYVDFVPEHCEYVTLPFFLALQVGLLARVEAGPASVTPLRLLEIYRCHHYLPVVRVLKRMFSDLVVEVV